MSLVEESEQIPAKRHRLKHVDIFEIAGDELDRIEEAAATIGNDLQFATFWIPVGITSTITLVTTTISNQWVFEGFFCTMLLSYSMGLYFGIKWFRNRSQFKRLVDRIRDRQVGPLGQEGAELKLSELENLPTSQAGPMQMALPPTKETDLLP